MEIVGKLEEKRDAIKRSETFTVREFVLEVQSRNSQYTDHILFQVNNDRCTLLDSFNIGDDLHVVFDINGRRWTAPDGTQRVFNTLSAWRIERYDAVAQQQAAFQQQQMGGYPQMGGFQQPMGGFQPQQNAAPVSQQPAAAPADNTEDLPF